MVNFSKIGDITMKSENESIIKDFLHNEIIKNAKEQNLTDEKVAELLGISVRSYYYIKSGKHNCSSATLLLYLIRICPDIDDFITKVRTIIM